MQCSVAICKWYLLLLEPSASHIVVVVIVALEVVPGLASQWVVLIAASVSWKKKQQSRPESKFPIFPYVENKLKSCPFPVRSTSKLCVFQISSVFNFNWILARRSGGKTIPWFIFYLGSLLPRETQVGRNGLLEAIQLRRTRITYYWLCVQVALASSRPSLRFRKCVAGALPHQKLILLVENCRI